MTALEASTTERNQTPPSDPPACIDSTGAKLVYVYLDTAGPTTISTLADALDMSKLTLYSVLDALDGKDVVTVEGETYGLAS